MGISILWSDKSRADSSRRDIPFKNSGKEESSVQQVFVKLLPTCAYKGVNFLQTSFSIWLKVFFPEFQTRFLKFPFPNERKSLECCRLEKEVRIAPQCQEHALNVSCSLSSFLLLPYILARG